MQFVDGAERPGHGQYHAQAAHADAHLVQEFLITAVDRSGHVGLHMLQAGAYHVVQRGCNALRSGQGRESRLAYGKRFVMEQLVAMFGLAGRFHFKRHAVEQCQGELEQLPRLAGLELKFQFGNPLRSPPGADCAAVQAQFDFRSPKFQQAQVAGKVGDEHRLQLLAHPLRQPAARRAERIEIQRLARHRCFPLVALVQSGLPASTALQGL